MDSKDNKDNKRSTSMIRRLIHRDSSPQLTFGLHKAAKESKTRRKSEGMLTVPERFAAPKPLMPCWYLKEIRTRDEAEELLNKQRVGTYLVRHSETSKLPGSYTLSLLHKDKCRHHKIETNPRNNKLVIKGYENHQFDDLQNLVDFFVKSQRKDIHLRPYDPNAGDQEDGMGCIEEQQPAYEDMDVPDRQDEYQEMDTGNSLASNQISFSSHGHGSPPPLPIRRNSQPAPQSYMNLRRDPVPPPPPLAPQSSQGYENIPPKDQRSPPPPPPSPKDAPPLPPRVPPSAGPGSYENIPARPPPVSRHHENHTANGKHENYSPQSSQAHSTPGHSYQNLPPKIAPRKSGKSYSAEQSLPPRKPTAPLRRTQTDTSGDWQRRGYGNNNM